MATVVFGSFSAQRWAFDVEGLRNIPVAGGAVIAANHTSYWDFFTLVRPPYEQLRRPMRIMAKESLFRTPVFGEMMRRSGHIPVHRGVGADALRSAVNALKGGEIVLVMPEQTVSRSLDLLPFKTGAVRMAAAAGVPLIPAVSWGSQRVQTIGRAPRPRWRLPVSVTYGTAMQVGPDDDVAERTEQLQSRVQSLLDATQQRYADADAAVGQWWHPERLGGGAPKHDDAVAEASRKREQWRSKPGDQSVS